MLCKTQLGQGDFVLLPNSLALVQLNRQKDVAPQIMPYKTVAYVNHRASWKGALTH